eukprot:scaffold1798_cov248-Pinguiococcus_pyrenoidosus.AAC.4
MKRGALMACFHIPQSREGAHWDTSARHRIACVLHDLHERSESPLPPGHSVCDEEVVHADAHTEIAGVPHGHGRGQSGSQAHQRLVGMARDLQREQRRVRTNLGTDPGL